MSPEPTIAFEGPARLAFGVPARGTLRIRNPSPAPVLITGAELGFAASSAATSSRFKARPAADGFVIDGAGLMTYFQSLRPNARVIWELEGEEMYAVAALGAGRSLALDVRAYVASGNALPLRPRIDWAPLPADVPLFAIQGAAIHAVPHDEIEFTGLHALVRALRAVARVDRVSPSAIDEARTAAGTVYAGLDRHRWRASPGLPGCAYAIRGADHGRLAHAFASGAEVPVDPPEMSREVAGERAPDADGDAVYLAGVGWFLDGDYAHALVTPEAVIPVEGDAGHLARAILEDGSAIVTLFDRADEPDPDGLVAELRASGCEVAQGETSEDDSRWATATVSRDDVAGFLAALAARGRSVFDFAVE